jgi:cytochrome c oxidase subunit IV
MAHGHDHAAAGHGHENAHGDEHVHHDHLGVYFRVFAALMILLIITLAAAAVDFQKVLGIGWLNIGVAMAIAVAKALIVVMYFMHVKWSSSLVRTFAAGTMLWLLIMFVMTLMDYLSRGMTQPFGR